jgi:hypothetical protein
MKSAPKKPSYQKGPFVVFYTAQTQMGPMHWFLRGRSFTTDFKLANEFATLESAQSFLSDAQQTDVLGSRHARVARAELFKGLGRLAIPDGRAEGF